MKTFRIEDFIGGWYCGLFRPVAFETDKFEAGIKIHKKGEYWDKHIHKIAIEINLLIRGKMIIQGKELKTGDVFILEPNEISDPEFLDDCEIFCIKTPGALNDKYVI